MKNQLKELFIQHKLLGEPLSLIIEWAIDMLEYVDDEDIINLSGLYAHEVNEVYQYIHNILEDDFNITYEALCEIAGKLIVSKSEEYYSNNLETHEFDLLIDKLRIRLDEPDWLVVLSRNAEYAIDIDNYVIPFHKELDYIVELWKSYPEHSEFISHYNREESNKRL